MRVNFDQWATSFETDTRHFSAFNQAKAKIATLLDKTVGMCYKIVPVNVKTGLNITPELTSFGGPPLMQLILEDQLRTNFDEGAFQKLCEVPLKVQLRRTYRIGGIGTVAVGRVISTSNENFTMCLIILTRFE